MTSIASMWEHPLGGLLRLYRFRDCFSEDVQASVHIRIETPASAGTKQPTFDPLTQVVLMVANGFKIEKAARAGVAFFLHHHVNAYQFCFVGQEIDEGSMRNLDKLLVVALTDVDLLFPTVIFPMNSVPIC